MQSTTRETWFLMMSIPFYAILISIEILLSNWQGKHFYSAKETIQNIYFTLLNAGLDVLLRWAFYITILLWGYRHAFFYIENSYLYWLALFLCEDIAFYFEHRTEHYCRIFWAVHVTHHSSVEYNLSTGFRSSIFQPVYRFVFLLPLTFVGFHPLDILFMYSATQTYGILVHTQYIKKMPHWFEAVFVSPSHHRVHHASNVRYLDKNMGMCLIIWDKLFGTFAKEIPSDPIRYGLTKSVDDFYNPAIAIFHEWKSLGKDLGKRAPFFTKIKYLIMPPGWSHDGSTLTAKQMRAGERKVKNEK